MGTLQNCRQAIEAFAVAASAVTDYGSLFWCSEQPYPLDFETALSVVWDDIEQLDDQDWTELRSFVDYNYAWQLRTYAARMATLAVREKDSTFVRYGLLALVLDNDLQDYRDVLIVCSVIYDAATRIGENPEGLFHRVARLAAPRRKGLLEGFVVHPRSVESMGFHITEEPNEGFIYRWGP